MHVITSLTAFKHEAKLHRFWLLNSMLYTHNRFFIPSQRHWTISTFHHANVGKASAGGTDSAQRVLQWCRRVSSSLWYSELWTYWQATSFVFVHGLNGHPLDTWTQQAGNDAFCWIKSLPESLRARVMTFGYIAEFEGGGDNLMGLRQHATSLLRHLKNKRRSHVVSGHFEEQYSR